MKWNPKIEEEEEEEEAILFDGITGGIQVERINNGISGIYRNFCVATRDLSRVSLLNLKSYFKNKIS